jgi:hypothetical protein
MILGLTLFEALNSIGIRVVNSTPVKVAGVRC